MTSNVIGTVQDEHTGPIGREPYENADAQTKDRGVVNPESDQDGETAEKAKPGVFASFSAKTGLDAPTLLMMFKGSLPPIIGIAMYQAPAVSSYFTTLGYLVPIISVLAIAILPRGKYIQNLILNVTAVCIGAAVSMLTLWSGVQARINTTLPMPPGGSPAPGGASLTAAYAYNSSQSAVCGVWLFANIWFVNTVRAKMPSFNLPVMIYSILVNISATYGPFMTTTIAAEAFIKELLTAMLVALALATGVNLVIFPVSSRKVAFKELAACAGLLRKMVALEKQCVAGLDSEEILAPVVLDGTESGEGPNSGRESDGDKPQPQASAGESKLVKELRETQAKLRELAGKLHGDIPFAKRDIAWGKLGAKDLGEMFTRFRNIYIPVLGVSTIMDTIKRVALERGGEVAGDAADEKFAAERSRQKRVWTEAVQQIQVLFDMLSQAIDQALEHARLGLELTPRPKSSKRSARKEEARPDGVDVEARGGDIRVGDAGFAAVVENSLRAYSAAKDKFLQTWAEQRSLAASEEDWDNIGLEDLVERKQHDQTQLFVILYMERLMTASGHAAHSLAAFADEKMRDGTMDRNRLIVPTGRRLRKWARNVFEIEDATAEQAPDLMEATANTVRLGDAYNRKKDPEHLPPDTTWQRLGDVLRKASKVLASEEAAFGFRAACATMTVGIVAFLESTQLFFMEQRLVWAMIIIAIGMNMTSGQSFFGFLCRVGGTVVAMCFSLAVWYIVDQRIPGVIVFLWLSVFADYYFFLKFPRFAPAVMITIVTQVLIIGYELQVLTIGQVAAARTGQPYYPTYELAPYRLACVAGGSLVAFIWTIFPSPLTDRTWLRRDLSATLYLLANYFSVINSSMHVVLHESGREVAEGFSPAHHLLKIRRKIFGKVMMLVPSMNQHAEWQRWEPTIGGKFPRKTYEEIIMRSTRIMGYLTLMSYTLTDQARVLAPSGGGDGGGQERKPQEVEEVKAPRDSLPAGTDEQDASETRDSADTGIGNQRAWLNALEAELATLEPTHHSILATLTLLSNSLLSGQGLPPFLPLPRPYELTRTLLRLSQGEPGPAAAQSRFRTTDARSPNARGRPFRYNAPPPPASGAATPAPNLLDPRNIGQPGYAEFAVLQVCSTLVCDDLEGLVHAVSSLVGVVGFSFWVDESGGGQGGEGVEEGDKKGKIE